MRARVVWIGWLLLFASSSAMLRSQEPTGEDASPKQDSGVVEHTERTLVQLDVTVRGPQEQIERLDAGDFELVIAGQVIDEFTADRVCVDDVRLANLGGDPSTPAQEPTSLPDRPQLSLLFYFDESHLVSAGRRRAIDQSRELIETLVEDGTRAMVVSAGKRLQIYADWTSDRSALLAAIDALETDMGQIDAYASFEDQRVQQVFRSLENGRALAEFTAAARNESADDMPGSLRTGNPFGAQEQASPAPSMGAPKELLEEAAEVQARSTARQLQTEERAHARQAMTRLSLMLVRMAELRAPKAIVYFGDTIRPNPGDHYWTLLGRNQSQSLARPVGVTHGSDFTPYQQVIDNATTLGVRFYAVQAAGLQGGEGSVDLPRSGLRHVSSSRGDMTQRFNDAKKGLGALASETGGRAYFGASPAALVARGIVEDLRCVFLLSFDAGDLPRGRNLSVLVNLPGKQLEVQTRTKMIIGTPEGRMESRLTAAFDAPSADARSPELRVGLIPTGFERGKFFALVQVAVASSGAGEANWDLGISVVARDRIVSETSGRIRVDRPGVPLVLEQIVRFPPGPFEVRGVAHDLAGDRILSRSLTGDWPDPQVEAATLGPVALLQPSLGVFLRDETERSSGALALAADDWVQPELPTSLIGVICRGSRSGEDVSLLRSLSGSTEAGFSPISLVGEKARCFAFSDLIRSDTMTAGHFRYDVQLGGAAEPGAIGVREFMVVAADE